MIGHDYTAITRYFCKICALDTDVSVKQKIVYVVLDVDVVVNANTQKSWLKQQNQC